MNKKIIITENQLKKIILENRKTELDFLRLDFAKAAQKVYDEWEQDEDGHCDWLGYGGICQDIAEAICDVLLEHDYECSSVSATIGEQHVYTIVKTDDGVYEVDISPYTYETGGGYCWKKIPNVIFDENDIIISRLSSDPEEYEMFIDN